MAKGGRLSQVGAEKRVEGQKGPNPSSIKLSDGCKTS